jgi:hypothetical protein
MKFDEHKLYIIERKDVPETDFDLDITRDMNYNRHWRNEAKLEDYVDGYAYINPEGYFPETVDRNENNITILKYSYEKLAYIAFCLACGKAVDEDIDNSLADFVSGIKEYVPDFMGFRFPLITKIRVGKTREWEEIEYDEDSVKYYDVGDYFEWQITNEDEFKKYGLDLVKIALSNRYILIIDDMEDSYIQRMIDDGIINLDHNRVLVLDSSDKIKSGFIKKDGVVNLSESEDDAL